MPAWPVVLLFWRPRTCLMQQQPAPTHSGRPAQLPLGSWPQLRILVGSCMALLVWPGTSVIVISTGRTAARWHAGSVGGCIRSCWLLGGIVPAVLRVLSPRLAHGGVVAADEHTGARAVAASSGERMLQAGPSDAGRAHAQRGPEVCPFSAGIHQGAGVHRGRRQRRRHDQRRASPKPGRREERRDGAKETSEAR